MKTGKRDVLVSEVGPRDGLQGIQSIMPTADKMAWISAAAAAGMAEIEVGSFVPARALPQLADTAALVAHARAIPGLNVAVMVPDLPGAQAALLAGAHKITIPLSVSETHSLRNLRRTHAQVLDEVRAISALVHALPAADRPRLEGGLSTAFGCTLEGVVPERRVAELAVALMEAGCDEVGLSDTAGTANPSQVRRLVKAVWAEIGRDQLSAIHLRDTRGLGLANVVAALDVGLTTFDSALAGLGGGNLVTEDLVFMLEAMGLRTGVDLDALFRLRALLARALPGEPLHGMTPQAGLPLGFVPATP
jgi:hydroxymethylglutaryl-CoA lyase